MLLHQGPLRLLGQQGGCCGGSGDSPCSPSRHQIPAEAFPSLLTPPPPLPPAQADRGRAVPLPGKSPPALRAVPPAAFPRVQEEVSLLLPPAQTHLEHWVQAELARSAEGAEGSGSGAPRCRCDALPTPQAAGIPGAGGARGRPGAAGAAPGAASVLRFHLLPPGRCPSALRCQGTAHPSLPPFLPPAGPDRSGAAPPLFPPSPGELGAGRSVQQGVLPAGIALPAAGIAAPGVLGALGMGNRSSRELGGRAAGSGECHRARSSLPPLSPCSQNKDEKSPLPAAEVLCTLGSGGRVGKLRLHGLGELPGKSSSQQKPGKTLIKCPQRQQSGYGGVQLPGPGHPLQPHLPRGALPSTGGVLGVLQTKAPRAGIQEGGKASPGNNRKIPRGQMWKLCVQQVQQEKQIRTPGRTEMNQSDKTEPKTRTPCSGWLILCLGNMGNPWIAADFPAV